ncbi:MAG: phosphate/phosphite/phosphonate ABC transporter substrate-binding protein, partial [Sedimentisphaerales bacterium]
MERVRWPIWVGLVIVALTAAVAIYLSGASHPKPTRRISLSASGGALVSVRGPQTRKNAFGQPLPARRGPEPISFPRRRETLRIAVGAMISPASSLVFYNDIFGYVEEKLGCTIKMVQRKTYAEVNFLLRQERIDAAFVCSRPYVEGHRNFGMELLCVPVCFGKTEYCSYFIVHKDSPIQNLEDLRGKVFAFSDPLSNSGMLIPVYVLAQMSETPESFFSRFIFTYSHDNSIHSVAEKFVDAAAVDSLIWEYENVKEPKWTAQTRIIYRSAPCGIPPLVVSPSIDHELKEKLRSALLNMHNDPRGREIL